MLLPRRPPGICLRPGALIVVFSISIGFAAAQVPETTARGAVNGVSFQPAPASVARGGIVAVTGANLTSALVQSSVKPLPETLDDPAVKVLINGVAAPLFFVSPDQINAQVPWEVEPGWAEVIVKRGEAESSAMPLLVAEASPNVFKHNGSNSLVVESGGEAPMAAEDGTTEATQVTLDRPASQAAASDETPAEVTSGQALTAFGAGMGPTDPAATTGATGEASGPTAPQRAYVGGIPATITETALSTGQVGVYELSFEVPALAGSGEILHWFSGDLSASGVLGARSGLAPRYLELPDGVGSVERIDMTDLNPYFVAASGALDQTESCYPDIALLDYRNEAATELANCALPSAPLAEDAALLRPFELSANSPVLAALVRPSGDSGEAATNRMILVDSVSGTITTVTLEDGADRLEQGFGGSRNLRILRPGGANEQTVIGPDGESVGDFVAATALPSQLEYEGLTRVVAQAANLGGGYRLRFLGPAERDTESVSKAVLYDREAAVVANTAFPTGWEPISPPRRVNNQGVEQGVSIAPTATGFRGSMTAYVVARSSDDTQDAIVAFRAELPEDSATESDTAGEEAPAVSLTSTMTAFPSGAYAANCAPQVRWQRLPLTQTLAILATGEVQSEFASPQANETCSGDRLLLFDTVTSEIESVTAPGGLDVAAKGTLQGYLFFADGDRDVALESPRKVHVFDGVTKAFSQIELPGGAGVTINLTTQRLGDQLRFVALATGGPPRTNANTGVQLPPLPGNRGLMVVDVAAGTAIHLTLPTGFSRIIPGNNQMVQQGRRGYGVLPLLDRGFAYARRVTDGPGSPGGSAMVTWDATTGDSTVLSIPDEAFSVIQPIGDTGPEGSFLWDHQAKSAAFSYGVYNRSGDLIAIGVVGP